MEPRVGWRGGGRLEGGHRVKKTAPLIRTGNRQDESARGIVWVDIFFISIKLQLCLLYPSLVRRGGLQTGNRTKHIRKNLTEILEQWAALATVPGQQLKSLVPLAQGHFSHT